MDAAMVLHSRDKTQPRRSSSANRECQIIKEGCENAQLYNPDNEFYKGCYRKLSLKKGEEISEHLNGIDYRHPDKRLDKDPEPLQKLNNCIGAEVDFGDPDYEPPEVEVREMEGVGKKTAKFREEIYNEFAEQIRAEAPHLGEEDIRRVFEKDQDRSIGYEEAEKARRKERRQRDAAVRMQAAARRHQPITRLRKKLNETTGAFSLYDDKYMDVAEGGGKKHKSRRTKRKGSKRKHRGSKRKRRGSKRKSRKSRKTHRR